MALALEVPPDDETQILPILAPINPAQLTAGTSRCVIARLPIIGELAEDFARASLPPAVVEALTLISDECGLIALDLALDLKLQAGDRRN